MLEFIDSSMFFWSSVFFKDSVTLLNCTETLSIFLWIANTLSASFLTANVLAYVAESDAFAPLVGVDELIVGVDELILLMLESLVLSDFFFLLLATLTFLVFATLKLRLSE